VCILFCGCSGTTDNSEIKIINKKWETIGKNLSLGNAISTAITVDNSGNPIVAYTDNGNSDIISVVKFINNKWINIGENNVSTKSCYVKKIIVDKEDNIYLLYLDYSVKVGNNFLVKPTVKKYNGSYWEVLGSERFTNFDTLYIDMEIDNNNNIYIAMNNNDDSNKLIIYKFNNGNWDIMSNNITDSISGIKLLIDTNNVIYIICTNTKSYTAGSMNCLLVKRFINGIWENLENEEFNKYVYGFSACLDKNNDLYVVKNEYKISNLNMIKYSNNSWSNIGVVDEADSYGDIILMSNSENVLSLFYDQIYLGQIKEYINNKWTNGNFVSSDKVLEASMAISKNNVVYVAFEDGENSFKLSVKKYEEIE
jgi:hypothetical protein